MKYIVSIISLLTIFSCSTTRNITYFNNAEIGVERFISQDYNHKIHKDDLLKISISSQSPDLIIPFTQTQQSVSSTTSNETDNSQKCVYLVNTSGNIIFPILGAIYAEGLTHEQLADVIETKLKEGEYILDPTVSVELKNFKITVLGEVKSPGVKEIATNRVTIFDALSLAGDMTIYGVRDSIAIIRENDGKRVVSKVDVHNKEILDSPYYYLQPNDIVYVEPNKKQQKQSDSNPLIVSYILSSLSVILTALNIIF